MFPPLQPAGWERGPDRADEGLFLTAEVGEKIKSPHPAFGHLLPLLRNGRREKQERDTGVLHPPHCSAFYLRILELARYGYIVVDHMYER